MAKLYYMRDNHTFLALPANDIKQAVILLAEEFIAGYKHGMLCSKQSNKTLGAGGDWEKFKPKAIEYIEEFKTLRAAKNSSCDARHKVTNEQT